MSQSPSSHFPLTSSVSRNPEAIQYDVEPLAISDALERLKAERVLCLEGERIRLPLLSVTWTPRGC